MRPPFVLGSALEGWRLGEGPLQRRLKDNTLAELAPGCEPPPVTAYGRDPHIVSIGSLSKLVWPGLRRLDPRLPIRYRPARAAEGGRRAGQLAGCQAIAVSLLADAERISHLRRAELTESLALLEDLLQGMLPDWRWRWPKGGLRSRGLPHRARPATVPNAGRSIGAQNKRIRLLSADYSRPPTTRAIGDHLHVKNEDASARVERQSVTALPHPRYWPLPQR